MNADTRGLQYAGLTEQILRVFFEVYNELGQGFLESVYEAAMMLALREAGRRVERQVQIPVWFRGQQIGDFRADVVVEDVVILELKAMRALEPAHEAQLLNYLRATPVEVGLLLNFGPRPTFKRLVFANDRKSIRVHPRQSAAQGGEVCA
jgi:GxxExxY protein